MIPHFKTKEHEFLSNFHLVDVEYEGDIYPSVEHAYMAAKSDDTIRHNGRDRTWKSVCADPMVTAGEVKRLSREVNLIPNWDVIKFQVMYLCLKSKFSKDPLKGMLLATDDQNLQEGNWWSDRVWGVDLKVNPNIGENHLGRLLMKVRDEIKNQ